uniref:Putative ovule protein n=1 Tax=Solanum chacoense TaxID=4108 RepID=A0A0V0H2A1_SOLCH
MDYKFHLQKIQSQQVIKALRTVKANNMKNTKDKNVEIMHKRDELGEMIANNVMPSQEFEDLNKALVLHTDMETV